MMNRWTLVTCLPVKTLVGIGNQTKRRKVGKMRKKKLKTD